MQNVRRSVQRLGAGTLLALSAWGVHGVAGAASASADGTIDWQQHDTMVYVVSTLNLLHQRNGQPATQVFRRWHVSSFDVYSDPKVRDLYCIRLQRDTQTVATFAYSMGWTVPRAISMPRADIRIRRAPSDVRSAIQTDPLQLIGSSTSSTPT